MSMRKEIMSQIDINISETASPAQTSTLAALAEAAILAAGGPAVDVALAIAHEVIAKAHPARRCRARPSGCASSCPALKMSCAILQCRS
jgi:hypothetical protein